MCKGKRAIIEIFTKPFTLLHHPPLTPGCHSEKLFEVEFHDPVQMERNMLQPHIKVVVNQLNNAPFLNSSMKEALFPLH